MIAVKGFDLFPGETNIWEIRSIEDNFLVTEFSVALSLNNSEQVLQAYLDFLAQPR